MSKVSLRKVNQQAAIDLLIQNPGLNKTEVAKQLDIPPRTIRSWFADDRFVDMYYKRYMTLFNSKLPMVLNSMIREAVEGNVMAGRLVLEHSGKLIKNINVTVDSPFEKFLKAKTTTEKGDILTEIEQQKNRFMHFLGATMVRPDGSGRKTYAFDLTKLLLFTFNCIFACAIFTPLP